MRTRQVIDKIEDRALKQGLRHGIDHKRCTVVDDHAVISCGALGKAENILET